MTAKSQAGKAIILKRIRRWGVGIFYFDQNKAARYNALSKKEGIIPTGFVHNMDDDGEKSSGKSEIFEKNPQKGTENGGTERIFLHVHEVFTEEEIKRSAGQLRAPEMQTREGSPSDLYRNILREVLNVKRENF